MLPKSYFARPTLEVARDLLGRHLVWEPPDGERVVGRIVETEGYRQDDPAFHGWHLFDEERGLLKKEGRGIELFGPPGEAYVYLIYGIHWLLNVVTEPEGIGGAVLIRAVEPVEGHEAIAARRDVRRAVDYTNGPGKLTEAFGITDAQHGLMMTQAPLYFEQGTPVSDDDVETSGRIGISRATDWPWRFYIGSNRYVSKAKPKG